MTVETPNDELETLSDREFIKHLSDIIGTALGRELADIRATQAITQRQLDHIDSMLHEVTQFLDEHKPALNRALGFLDAGKSWRDYLKRRKEGEPDE